MPIETTVNPYATETRYSIDLALQLLAATAPRGLRIYSGSAEAALMVARRVGADSERLIVATPEIQAALAHRLGVIAEVGTGPADAGLILPDAARTAQPDEAVVAGVFYNPYSYKTLRAPRSLKQTAPGLLARLRHTYDIDRTIGLYAPPFLILLALAQMVGRHHPAAHFRLSDAAMQRIYHDGPLWRVSYVVVFRGRRYR